jgi:hypothetical protein
MAKEIVLRFDLINKCQQKSGLNRVRGSFISAKLRRVREDHRAAEQGFLRLQNTILGE